MSNANGSQLLVVEDLKKHFPVTRGIVFQKEIATVKAVDGVSFSLREGETLGIVGESGCGKSTLVRCILKLLEPTGGRILFQGQDITGLSRREMRPLRRNMMMVFQDPYASLNARKRVGFIIGEALELHGIGTPAERKRRVQELLEVVGLNPEHYNRFPHEFSGGQRQRIGVARALAVNPKLIFCDEPVSALDVSVQAQILNLLKDLQREFGLTYVFIAHDLNVVRHISDRVMVMYLGKAVELADRDELYAHPKHPYTGALLSAVPIPSPEAGRLRKSVVLEGDVPNPINPPSACNFHPRCPRFQAGHCDVDTPPLAPIADDHLVACHYPLERWPMSIAEQPAAVQPVESAGSGAAGPGVGAVARRIVLLFGLATIAIAAVSAVIGLALGASMTRSAATGLYLVGCFLIVLGVFAGVRGPLRPAGDAEDAEPLGGLLGVGIFSRGVRRATSDEREDARSTAWLFLAMGVVMVVVGIVVDPRTSLF